MCMLEDYMLLMVDVLKDCRQHLHCTVAEDLNILRYNFEVV